LPPSISEKLITGKKLREKGKYKEALENTESILKKEGLTAEERISCLILQANLYYDLWQLNSALKIAEQICQESNQLDMNPHYFDALVIVATIYFWFRKKEKVAITIRQIERVVKSITGLSPTELLKRKAVLARVKAFLCSLTRKYDQAFEYQNQSFKLYKELGVVKDIAESVWWLSYFLFIATKLDKALNYSIKGLGLRKELDSKVDIAQSLVLISIILGWIGDIEKALIYGKQALEIEEILTRDKIWLLIIFGFNYHVKGELDRSFEYYKRALEITERLDHNRETIECLRNMSTSLKDQGKSHIAIEYLEKAVKLAEEGGFNISRFLPQFIRNSVIIGNIEQARKYLKKYQLYRDTVKSKDINQVYRELEAEILRKTGKISDKEEAEKILRNLLKEGCIVGAMTISVIIQLCHLLLGKLRRTNNFQILDEIRSLTNQLVKISEEQRSYSYLANAYLLQAKLNLIQGNIVSAGSFFTQAQHTADWHGQNTLARNISREHDKLLENREKWKSLHKTDSPLLDRIKFSSMATTLEVLEGNRRFEITELEKEYPVLLAIMSKTGYIVFTNPFSVEVPFDENRIGEFVSFFNSISSQMYSESLDRAKFGDHTIILKTLDSISFCYLFEGESYTAQLRLNAFCESIEKDTVIMETLNTAIQTGNTINITEHPILETLIAETFLSDPQKLQVSAETEEVQKLVKKSRKIRKRRATRKQRLSKIVITETLIEIVSLLLFLTSHLLFLGYIGKLEAAWIVPGEKGFLVYVDLTLYLGMGGHLIVLTIMIINWLNETVKNIWVKAEILVQIAALILFLAAQLLYFSFLEFLPKLDFTDNEYGTIIDIPFYIGIACQLVVIVLILNDYMKHH
jgi:tetratricopeptide (TPR) repeat protein